MLEHFKGVSHLEVMSNVRRLEKTRLDVTSSSRNLRKTRLQLPSRSRKLEKTRDVAAYGDLARHHFKAAWLVKNMARSHLGPRRLKKSHFEGKNTQDKSTPAFSARESHTRGHFEVTWLEKARLEGTSKSRPLSSKSFPSKTKLRILRTHVSHPAH